MQKQSAKNVVRMLREYPFWREAVAYRRDQIENAELVDGSLPETARQIRVLDRKICAVEHGLKMLSAAEKNVIEKTILENKTAEEVCEECAMERSTVFRYRKSALGKMQIILGASGSAGESEETKSGG